MADTTINTPKDQNNQSYDIVDFSAELSQLTDLTKKGVSNSFENFDKLQQEVSKKQKDFMNSYYADLKKAEADLANATTARDRAKFQQDISNLKSQKMAFNEVADTLKEIAELEAEKSRKLFDRFTGGFASMINDISKSFKAAGGGVGGVMAGGATLLQGLKSNPIISFLIDVLMQNDKLTTDIARNLGVSKDEANNMLDSYRGIAFNAGITGVHAKELIEANQQITGQYKIMAPLTAEILTNQAFMVKRLGLQVEEANRLSGIFAYNRTEGEKGLNVVYQQVAQYAKQNGILFSGKAILSDISKLGGQIRATFQGNTEEIAKAVIQAARLGTTLEQTRSMSESLLNFETSIDNELKAELLTGQQLNLEKARALALSGRYLDAGKEMLKQAGGINNFERMNVIQQKAMAEAVGLTADQLSDIKYKQSEIGILAGDLAKKYEAIGNTAMADRIRSGKLDAESLKLAESQLTAQQRFEESMERVKEIFSNMINNNIMDRFAVLMENFVNVWSSKGFISAITHDYSQDIRRAEAKKEFDAAKDQELRNALYSKRVYEKIKEMESNRALNASMTGEGYSSEDAKRDVEKAKEEVKKEFNLTNTTVIVIDDKKMYEIIKKHHLNEKQSNAK